jgi:hypothetical protein
VRREFLFADPADSRKKRRKSSGEIVVEIRLIADEVKLRPVACRKQRNLGDTCLSDRIAKPRRRKEFARATRRKREPFAERDRGGMVGDSGAEK